MNHFSHRHMTARGTAAVLLASAALAVAGCGGSSSGDTTTAATPPAQTATTATDRPATLTPTQTTRFDSASRSFVSATSLFLVRINRCAASKSRKRCVRTAADRAERVVTRTRDDISALATSVGGSCSSQLGDVRSKISDVTDVLSPMAEAMQTGRLRDAGQLGAQAQSALRSFATSSQIMQRAC